LGSDRPVRGANGTCFTFGSVVDVDVVAINVVVVVVSANALVATTTLVADPRTKVSRTNRRMDENYLSIVSPPGHSGLMTV